MSGQSRKHRGYASQRIVAEYLRANGFAHAEPVGAGRPGSDITGLVGLDVEVKARRDLDLPGLIRQMRSRQASDVLGLAVIRPDGAGPATVDWWPSVMPLAWQVALLRGAGFGDPSPMDGELPWRGPGTRPPWMGDGT